MSEMAKTLSFVAAAAVALLAAYSTGPGEGDFDVQSEVGKTLNEFTIDDAKSLRIATFDKDTATGSEFEVAEEDGLWTIPSKQGYPADAVQQMADAATCLIDREVLRVAADNAVLHEELGLIDPTSPNLGAKSKGVGTRVTMTDNGGKTLTDMIIGKQVLDEEEQYYVRNADSDYAYVIALDPEPLTTRFEDWIEKDLLNLNSTDVNKVHIKDYSAQTVFTLQGRAVATEERSEMKLRFDEADNKWIADEVKVYDEDERLLVDQSLTDDEEIDQDALRDLRFGLADVTIVDVERKPKGLSADLQAGSEFLDNEQAILSLSDRGFSATRNAVGEIDLLSSEGEIVATLNTGVEYVLRFGNLKLDSDGGSSETAKSDPNAEADDGIHRYLFVMARLNKSAIEQPELPALPELPEGVEPPTDEAEEDAEDNSKETEADEESDTTEESAEEDSADAEEETEEEDDDVSELLDSYKAVQQERDQMTKEYEDKVAAAEKTVRELNERFGDWYYVIDNKVFKDIHLGRDDVIKKKEEEKEEDAADAAPSQDSVPGVPNLPLGQ